MKKSPSLPKARAARSSTVKHSKKSSAKSRAASTRLNKRSGGYLRISLKSLNFKSKPVQAVLVALVFTFIGLATLLFSSASTSQARCTNGCVAIAGVGTNKYWVVGGDGGVFTFGEELPFYGSDAGITTPVGMAARPQADGYWVVGVDGGVFTHGAANFWGSVPQLISEGAIAGLNQPIVGIAATPSGNGYWLVAADGGIFTFGDAPYLGSIPELPAEHHKTNVTGIASTASGNGYWILSGDGGVYTFGDAPFDGAPAGENTTAITRAGSSNGYWVVTATGGVFSYNGAPFQGSLQSQGVTPNSKVTSIASASDGNGYWLSARDGGIFAFGSAEFVGNPEPTPPPEQATAAPTPVVEAQPVAVPGPQPETNAPAPEVPSAPAPPTVDIPQEVCDGNLKKRKTLTAGMRDVCVADLVRMLRIVMPDTESSDSNEYNDQLYKNVVAYQTAVGLTPDGVVGLKTWTSLSQGVTSDPRQFAVAIEQITEQANAKAAAAAAPANNESTSFATKAALPGKLARPENVRCKPSGDRLTIVWDQVKGADNYKINNNTGAYGIKTLAEAKPAVLPFVQSYLFFNDLREQKRLTFQQNKLDMTIVPFRGGEAGDAASLNVDVVNGNPLCMDTADEGEYIVPTNLFRRT